MLWIALAIMPIVWVLIDISAGLRARKFQSSTLQEAESSDFSILVPIYGSVKYLENVEYLSKYSDQVVLCTTSGETEKFYTDLTKIASKNNFQIFKSPYSPSTNSNKRRTGGVIRDQVIRDALVQMNNLRTYTICIDADTTTPQPLEKLAGAFEVSEADFGSISLIPQEHGGILVQLQRHEYRQSMRIRFLLPWMLSGACHIGKTETFRQIMSQHSLFFQGNDVEAGLLGDQMGYKSVHLPFAVNTEVPSDFKSWWRQRIAWAGGEFRLFIINAKYILKHPLLWLYGGVVAILLVSLRWWSILEPTWILLGVALMYYISIIWIHWRTRNWWLLLLPIYTLFNSMILTPIGIFWYFVMAIPEKNFGIISTNRREVEVTA